MLAGEHVLPLTDTLQARARASARASAGARDVVIVSVGGVGGGVVDGLFEAEGFGLGMALIFFAKTLNSMRTDGTSLLIPCNPYSALPTACADREWGEMSMAWASTDSSSWICRLLLVMF